VTDPLDPAILAEIAARLRQVDRDMTAPQAAHRLYIIADILATGKPQREMFLLAIAVALMGAAACPVTDAVGRVQPAIPFRSGTHG
jgi:hypothetical protein